MDIPTKSAANPKMKTGAMSPSITPPYPTPPKRMLRVYAFDPQASVDLDTAVINDAVIQLPWETPWEDPLEIGPCNDYLEVVDYDPSSGLFYAPVDLNDPALLAQNGLPPAEGRPQFHQQMVFAVAMKTIRNFERALGRPVMWSREARRRTEERKSSNEENYHPTAFVKRLRIYPHALREANAYYSPDKCALLFGYFRGSGGPQGGCDGWVFTCLSQDIIAHETTHAILHGMYRRSIEPTSADTLAFHEAFADIVALFQHFTMQDVLVHQIANTRGSLRGETLLTGLAQQFGEATGRAGALRYALEKLRTPPKREVAVQPATTRQLAELARLGQESNALLGGLLDSLVETAGAIDPDGTIKAAVAAIRTEAKRDQGPAEAKAERFEDVTEPHERGSFLVAAIFDAFVTIYERRTSDLMRIATGTSNPDGRELSPDLVGRLAAEAAKAADHVLRMCVRGLDYLPPVDMRFGEYLRAIITADADLVPDDPLNYRVAFAQAFRNRDISVPGCISMAPDSLIWERPDPGESTLLADDQTEGIFASVLPKMRLGLRFPPLTGRDVKGDPRQPGPRLNLREESHKVIQVNQEVMGAWLNSPSDHDAEWEKLFGVQMVNETANPSIPKSPWACKHHNGEIIPAVEVHSVRVARRSGPDGQELHQLIMQVTQRRRGYFSDRLQKKADTGRLTARELKAEPDFWFRGGATIHADLRDGRIRRIIRKRIDDKERFEAQREFLRGDSCSHQAARLKEPFAMLHRSEGYETDEWR